MDKEYEEEAELEHEMLNYLYSEILCNYSSEEDAGEAFDGYDD
ncbi:hypothetical protein [Cohnella endophytica]|nr:hypothetical protein [Cohnella endophytica]